MPGREGAAGGPCRGRGAAFAARVRSLFALGGHAACSNPASRSLVASPRASPRALACGRGAAIGAVKLIKFGKRAALSGPLDCNHRGAPGQV